MARKLQLADLPANPDPRAALDTPTFLRAARPVLAALTADLLARADADPGIRAALEQHHQAELEASRTADDYAVWRRHIVVQVAAAWLLSCVFVRVLEDRGLIATRIAGTGARDSEEAFFRVAPSLGEREYLLIIFRELARLPAAAPLFAPEHNLVWRLGPSAEGCKRLLQVFRTPHGDAPTFRFGHADTRFLGDLYQHIDDGVREQFALLQTPDFIEIFILDRTLEPAIAEYGVDHTDIIDPTCGSGHFLLGAFTRIFDHLRNAHPNYHPREVARSTLAHIYGADINPYAVYIARFRLVLKFIETALFIHLTDAPRPTLHVVVADSLFYGSAGDQGNNDGHAGQASKQAFSRHGPNFSLEDPDQARSILGKKTYAAVVGNPPYISVRDPILNRIYREKYISASGKYTLAAPFMERFFRLAKKGGHVGQITSNSFMKREFGATLIEQVIRHLDITILVNSSGVFIPGHNTPTIIVIGQNQAPLRNRLTAILSKRGEPGEPPIAAEGHVWRSIKGHWDDLGFEDEYICVTDLSRIHIDKHPWSLEGSGSTKIKIQLDDATPLRLSHEASTIGVDTITGEDDIFIGSHSWAIRATQSEQNVRRLCIGESIRDWGMPSTPSIVFPYNERLEPTLALANRALHTHLWPYRTTLASRWSSRKETANSGKSWYEYSSFRKGRPGSTVIISFPFIATHNHFKKSEGGFLFNRSAPIIIPNEVGRELQPTTLSYLNSSTTCFWLKQVAYPKGTPTGDISSSKGAPENNRYEFSCSIIGNLPVPTQEMRSRLANFSEAIVELQALRDKNSPWLLATASPANPSSLTEIVGCAEREDASLLARMVAIQEDLDWAVYAIFDLAPPETAGRWTENLELTPDQRPFKSPDPPPHLGPADRELWHARANAIANSKELRLIENPVNKRRWWGARGVFAHKVATYAERVADAAVEHIADLAEQALRTRCERSLPAVFTARDLERDLDREPKYQALRDYLHTRDPAHDPLRDQLARESVPFLAGYRYSPAGRDRHERWREVWALQRIADVSEAELPRLREAAEAAATSAREAAGALSALRQRLGFPTFPLAPDPTPPRRGARKTPPPPPPPPPAEDPATKPPELLAAEAHELAARGAQNQARLELADAESHHHKLRKLIPVPSKYEPTDFRDPNYFRLRGKLDVPRERFISYPGAASDGDPSPVYGWAGWDHLQRALALLQLYYHRKLEQTWPAERLIPLLAGLEELLPWVRQWHADERHPDTGERYADALDAHITAGCSELGVTRPQLVAWAPSDARRRRAASPVNRAHKTTAPRTKPSTASLANRRSARRADAVSLDPEAPPPELTNKRRASESPSAPDPVDATATPRRRGRSRNAG